MKKIFSIILPLLLLGGGITLAFNVQDEPICEELGHPGYNYTLPGNPTPTFNPLTDPLPSGWVEEGQYGPNFTCEESEDLCHWAYKPAQGSEPAQWVPCQGDIDRTSPTR